ncbi:uncharacterized protein yc1106_08222 [Curvularia clavata]|uniref:Rhodopsin domain-containing protein n=1 Tax=Curvularia clavata TaxID=95742 RepID=A0A9Q9DUF5_CURCL|nr:uncharacterized protein yc1106_08222 [Curvularia clavata]
MNADNSTPAGIRVNIIVLAFTLVSGLVVFLRLFTRLVISKNAGLEDACIVLAMIFSLALTVLITEQVMNGLGEHSSNLEKNKLDILLKAFWASVWVYNLTLTTIKVSILTQYLRIFPIHSFRIICFVVLGLVVAYGAWAVSSSVFICNPVAFSWDKSIIGGSCLNQLTIWVANAGINITQDVVIFLMPLFVVQGLPISKSQKKGLRAMFILGLSVSLVSVIRLYSLDAISNSTDVSFDNTDHATLSAVEVNVGIICACLPAMRPLFALVLPQYFSDAPRYLKHRTFKVDVAERGKCLQSANRHLTMPNGTALRPNLSPSVHNSVPTRPSTAHTRSDSTVRRFSTAQTRSGTASRRPSSVQPNADAAKFKTNAFGSDSTQEDVPLDELHSVFSRPTGRSFSLPKITPLPPLTPRSHRFQGHSRSASNTSVQSTASAARERSIARLQLGNPLRMSPITPSSPEFPAPLRIQKTPSLPPGSWIRRPSNATVASQHPPKTPKTPKTPGTDKDLPVTPFPIGSAQ